MRRARCFLPCLRTLLINFATKTSLYFGSGVIILFAAVFFLIGRYLANSLCLLGSILRPALFSIGHTRGVEGSPDDVVSHTGKILHPAAADQNDRVFL